MKRMFALIALVLVAGILTIMITSCEDDDGSPSTTTTTTPPTTLTAPTQLSPSNGATFNHFPRTPTLVWTDVPGATSYGVEIEYYDGTWHNLETTTVSSTTYTFSFVGAQPGRWRVWAIDEDGNAGPKSGWFEFTFTI